MYELFDLKKDWGFFDLWNIKEYENCDICVNDIFCDSWLDVGVEWKVFDVLFLVFVSDLDFLINGVD